MKQYNVWFSFRDGCDEVFELSKVRTFVDDLLQRELIHSYRLLRNCAKDDKTRLSTYQLAVEFESAEQFAMPFAEVEQLGIHSGLHGEMIASVEDFIVEVFEDVPLPE